MSPSISLETVGLYVSIQILCSEVIGKVGNLYLIMPYFLVTPLTKELWKQKNRNLGWAKMHLVPVSCFTNIRALLPSRSSK